MALILTASQGTSLQEALEKCTGQELCKCQVIVQQKSCKIWKILATTINTLFMACKYSNEYRLLLGKNKHRANFPKYSLITKFQFVCSCLWENTRLQAAQLKKPRRIYNSLSYFPTDKGIKAKNLGKWRGKTRVWMTSYILKHFTCWTTNSFAVHGSPC